MAAAYKTFYSPANLILSKSKGCRINVEVTPPDIPATRCSYLMWLSNASLVDDELGFFIVVMTNFTRSQIKF